MIPLKVETGFRLRLSVVPSLRRRLCPLAARSISTAKDIKRPARGMQNGTGTHVNGSKYDIGGKLKQRKRPEDKHSRSTEQTDQDENETRQTAPKQNKEQKSRPRNAIRQHRWQTTTENAKRDMNSMANKERNAQTMHVRAARVWFS